MATERKTRKKVVQTRTSTREPKHILGVIPRQLRGRLDFGAWSPPGWVVALAFRLCDPTDRRTKTELYRELGVTRTTSWYWETMDEFKDLMSQIHAAFNGTAYYEVYAKTLKQALDGSIEAQKVFYQITGVLSKDGTASRSGTDRRSAIVPDIDDFEGESRENVERYLFERLDLIRARRLALDEQERAKNTRRANSHP